jgi:hypothetical protein
VPSDSEEPDELARTSRVPTLRRAREPLRGRLRVVRRRPRSSPRAAPADRSAAIALRVAGGAPAAAAHRPARPAPVTRARSSGRIHGADTAPGEPLNPSTASTRSWAISTITSPCGASGRRATAHGGGRPRGSRCRTTGSMRPSMRRRTHRQDAAPPLVTGGGCPRSSPRGVVRTSLELAHGEQRDAEKHRSHAGGACSPQPLVEECPCQ